MIKREREKKEGEQTKGISLYLSWEGKGGRLIIFLREKPIHPMAEEENSHRVTKGKKIESADGFIAGKKSKGRRLSIERESWPSSRPTTWIEGNNG